jgi:hypothetical protein
VVTVCKVGVGFCVSVVAEGQEDKEELGVIKEASLSPRSARGRIRTRVSG